MKGLKRYVRIFRGVKLPWFLLFITLVIAALDAQFNVEAVTMTASIVDASQKAIKTEELVSYVLFLLATGILAVADSYLAGLAYQKINRGVRTKLWNKIMRLPSRYYDVDNESELVSRVTTDADSSSYYFELLISSLTSVYSAVAVFIRLFAFEASLAAWMLLLIPFCVGVGALYGLVAYHAGYRSAAAFAGTTGYLAERIRNFKMIKAFGMESAEKEQGRRLFKKQFGSELMLEMTVALIQVGIEAIGCICIVIAFVAGGVLVRNGTLTIGKLVAFYSLSGMVSVGMIQLYMNFGAFTEVNGIMKKISLILDMEEEASGTVELSAKDEDIRFQNVSFSYGDMPVLKNVTVTIPKGKVTALIGSNGAGKSTMMKLVERMYDPDQGRILFGDQDIREIRLKSWRDAFALVAQDSPLLSGTVRENILYGVEEAVSEEKLTEVAKRSNIYEFVTALPEGFDAQVGAEGSNFSGGQRQCIAIARALMRGSRYLLLDEATSNLDVNSEELVSEAFEALMEGRTTLMIAHNYAATKHADYVIVMRDGQVEASGTPEELLKSNEYYQMFAHTGKEPVEEGERED